MKLTKREKQISELIANGLDNDEICNELDIQISTFKSHLFHLYKKFDIKRSNHTNDCRSLLVLKLLGLKIKYAESQTNQLNKMLIYFMKIYQEKLACMDCPVQIAGDDCNNNQKICLERIWNLINLKKEKK